MCLRQRNADASNSQMIIENHWANSQMCDLANRASSRSVYEPERVTCDTCLLEMKVEASKLRERANRLDNSEAEVIELVVRDVDALRGSPPFDPETMIVTREELKSILVRRIRRL